MTPDGNNSGGRALWRIFRMILGDQKTALMRGAALSLAVPSCVTSKLRNCRKGGASGPALPLSTGWTMNGVSKLISAPLPTGAVSRQ